MPPIAPRSASLPTVVSLVKLVQLIPAALNARHASHAKRDTADWAVSAAAFALDEGGGDENDMTNLMFMLVLFIVLVLLGGVFAGLTLALMGSDDLNLRVLAASSDDPKERRDAGKVLRLLSRGRHWVLVVLLLANVIVNESLPIFLAAVFGHGVYAVLVSTIMIVIFGEVIPQAVCVRYGLAIGGACAPFVQFMMFLFAPVAWPLAKLLDWILGHDSGHTYKKAELKSFLQFHREGEEPLRDDEITILNGVLSLNDRHVKEIMTPIEDCLTLPADKILDHETVDQILISGFSRIPIHEPGQPDNFIGMVLVKRLITYNPEQEWPVNKFILNSLPEATPDLNCFQALDYFQTGRAHLLLISETPGRRGGALGIISLEDLIEEIIGEEIIDETDRYQDNHSKRKAQRRATREIMRGIIERQRVINAFSRRPSASASRTQSPNPGFREIREDVLVELADGAITAEPELLGLSFQNELKVGDDEVTIIATSPNGQEMIVEQPAAKAGSPQMIGDSERSNSSDSGQTAKAPVPVDTELPAVVVPASEEIVKAAEAKTAEADASAVITTSSETPGETSGEVQVEIKNDNASDDTESNPNTPTTSEPSSNANKKKANGKRRKVIAEEQVSEASKEQEQHRQDQGQEPERERELEHEQHLCRLLVEPFPSTEAFKTAAQAFITKYANEARDGLGAQRTNAGWEWRAVESKWHGEQGYMARRTVFVTRSESDEAPAQIEGDAAAEMEEEEDPAAAPQPRVSAASVAVELSVVYSATYRVPMLCLRAWGGDGAPLSLSRLIAAGVLRTGAANTGTEGGRQDALMLPGAPFPLLQLTEHPVTGDVVWSVHPCEVRGAVAEIVAAEGAAPEESEPEAFGVHWLEAWFMLSDSVVDLTL